MAATTGAVQDKASFSASLAGLERARTWIAHRAGQQAALVVIEGIGSYGAGLTDRVLAAGFPVAEPSVMGSADRRGVGKTDDLDAARIARSVLSVDVDRLRRPRADGSRVAMRVLVVAREQMTCERTRAVNALTALVRTVELGVDARKSLTCSQITAIANWRAPGVNRAGFLAAPMLATFPAPVPCRRRLSIRELLRNVFDRHRFRPGSWRRERRRVLGSS